MPILVYYNEVFNEDGEVKLCGRERCMDLILACENLKKGVDFGNSKTGMMNIENIKTFISELKSE